MNTLTLPFAFALDAQAGRNASASDPYATDAQTAALLQRGAEYRRQRVSAPDMVTTDAAAAISGTSRVTINAWIKSGRCIGVAYLRRGFKVPTWQFEPRVFSAIQPVASALGTVDGWQILSFLETPHEALDGLQPRLALEQGASTQRIIDLATAAGY